MGQAMSGGGDEPAADGFWASARRRYEDGSEPVSAIAADGSITPQALTSRARAEGWKLRTVSKKRGSTRETIARLKALLQQRLAELEGQIDALSGEASAATNERDIRAMNTLVRTLEKVLELERKERSQRTRRSKAQRQFDDAEREALARKLMGLRREIRGDRVEPGAAQLSDPGGEKPQS